MKKIFEKKFDYIVELMATNPLKSVIDINNVIKIILRNKADSVIAVNKLFDHHPARIKKIIKGDFMILQLKKS